MRYAGKPIQLPLTSISSANTSWSFTSWQSSRVALLSSVGVGMHVRTLVCMSVCKLVCMIITPQSFTRHSPPMSMRASLFLCSLTCKYAYTHTRVHIQAHTKEGGLVRREDVPQPELVCAEVHPEQGRDPRQGLAHLGGTGERSPVCTYEHATLCACVYVSVPQKRVALSTRMHMRNYVRVYVCVS